MIALSFQNDVNSLAKFLCGSLSTKTQEPGPGITSLSVGLAGTLIEYKMAEPLMEAHYGPWTQMYLFQKWGRKAGRAPG